MLTYWNVLVCGVIYFLSICAFIVLLKYTRNESKDGRWFIGTIGGILFLVATGLLLDFHSGVLTLGR